MNRLTALYVPKDAHAAHTSCVGVRASNVKMCREGEVGAGGEVGGEAG